LVGWSQRSYIYLSPVKHAHWVWEMSEAFPSQFVRRVCAEILGLGPFYDWAVSEFTENMLVTRFRLEDILSARLRVNAICAA